MVDQPALGLQWDAESISRYVGVLIEVRQVATRWAGQATDYDEDTEQQIADGREILALLAKCGDLESPKFPLQNATLPPPRKRGTK